MGEHTFSLCTLNSKDKNRTSDPQKITPIEVNTNCHQKTIAEFFFPLFNPFLFNAEKKNIPLLAFTQIHKHKNKTKLLSPHVFPFLTHFPEIFFLHFFFFLVCVFWCFLVTRLIKIPRKEKSRGA